MDESNFEDKTLTGPIIIAKKDIATASVLVHAEAFLLQNHQFYILWKGSSDTLEWSKRLAWAGAALAIPMIIKLLYFMIASQIVDDVTTLDKRFTQISPIDFWSMLLAFTVSRILKLFSKKYPSHRDKLITILKNFFNY